MNRHSVSAVLLAASLLTAAGGAHPMLVRKPAIWIPVSSTTAAPSVTEARLAMRKLWDEHLHYTRNYIVCALAELPDTASAARRLLANQDDIGTAINPYFGGEAGRKLSALLRHHVSIASEVVKAAKADDRKALGAAQAQWSNNARDIAAFLGAVNPYWSKAELEAMLQRHLDLTTGVLMGRVQQDWEADLQAYDQAHAHVLALADVLSDGIAKQFPEKFK